MNPANTAKGAAMENKMNATTKIRWTTIHDLERIVEIERLSFPEVPPEEMVTKDQLVGVLRDQNMMCQVIEDESGLILGYMIYELRKHEIKIGFIVVHPVYRRFGFGTAMLDKLKSKLRIHYRRSLRVFVFDDNLDAHLFFRDSGFSAISVVRNYWLTGLDAYEFRYSVEGG